METSYKHLLPAVEIHTTIYFWLPCMSSKNESNILVGAGDTQVLLGEATSCTTYHILSCQVLWHRLDSNGSHSRCKIFPTSII